MVLPDVALSVNLMPVSAAPAADTAAGTAASMTSAFLDATDGGERCVLMLKVSQDSGALFLAVAPPSTFVASNAASSSFPPAADWQILLLLCRQRDVLFLGLGWGSKAASSSLPPGEDLLALLLL